MSQATQIHPVAPRTRSVLVWIGFNLTLLCLYLGFFNLCFVVVWPWTVLLGLVAAGIVVGFYLRFRSFFLNRYEALFYSAIPLDILMESVSPYHTDYSFYGCAASFWTLFIGYRCVLLLQRHRMQRVIPPDNLLGQSKS
jgi:hypothetical protein